MSQTRLRRASTADHPAIAGRARRRDDVDDLVDRLYPGEPTPVDDPVPDRDRFAALLAHSHLPTLADFGVVEFDRQDGTVRYRPDEQLEAVLDSLPGEAVETES